jgi:hypothetical protein
MRDLVMARIREIKDGHGSDLFTTLRGRKGSPKFTTMAGRWHVDEIEQWAKLPDKELLEQYEMVVMRSYRQR